MKGNGKSFIVTGMADHNHSQRARSRRLRISRATAQEIKKGHASSIVSLSFNVASVNLKFGIILTETLVAWVSSIYFQLWSGV